MVNAIRGVNEVLWSLVKKEECGFYLWEQCKLLWGSAEFQPCKNQFRHFLCAGKTQVPILCQGPGYTGSDVFVLAKIFLSAGCHISFLPPPQFCVLVQSHHYHQCSLLWLLMPEMLRCTFDLSKDVSSQASPARASPLSFRGGFVMLSCCCWCLLQHQQLWKCSSISCPCWVLPACFPPLEFLQCSTGLDCKKGI